MTVQLVTTDQAAQLLGISPRRVRAICQKKGIGTKLGAQWVLTPEDVKRIRAAHGWRGIA